MNSNPPDLSVISRLGILGISYLTTLPAEVPDGRCLVHNSVRPTRRLGSRGFRAWTTSYRDRLEVCDCSWAPELGQHYRIERGLR